MIRKASLEESKLIYKKYMIDDFPDDELPGYNRYIKLTKEKMHDVYLLEENSEVVAYFITTQTEGNILITHLAVVKKFRSKGIGKRLLNEIKSYFSKEKMLIVEVEAESRANNKEELEIINRRKRYYLKSGFIQCNNMKYILYNVEYDILVHELNKNINSDNYKIKEIMEKIYSRLGINKSKLEIEIK